MKRAENAIFARAINAIRPSIEIKKICPERQKLYSNEVASEQEKSPTTSSTVGHLEKAAENLPSNSLQITLLNSEQERSVELKSGTTKIFFRTLSFNFIIFNICNSFITKVRNRIAIRHRCDQLKIVWEKN